MIWSSSLCFAFSPMKINNERETKELEAIVTQFWLLNVFWVRFVGKKKEKTTFRAKRNRFQLAKWRRKSSKGETMRILLIQLRQTVFTSCFRLVFEPFSPTKERNSCMKSKPFVVDLTLKELMNWFLSVTCARCLSSSANLLVYSMGKKNCFRLGRLRNNLEHENNRRNLLWFFFADNFFFQRFPIRTGK